MRQNPQRDGEARQIAILLLPSFSNLTLAAVIEPLRAANRFLARRAYAWRIVSEDGRPLASSSGLGVQADGALDRLDDVDALYVVASYDVERHTTPAVRRAVRAAARRGAMLAGLESGAYVLALAGVLDGYRATTHWEDLDDFAERFPAITVVPDRFVRDRNRSTSGGALPALDFMLDQLRREQGLALALAVSSTFIYEQERAAGDPQHMVSAGRLAWRDPALVKAIRLMEANIEAPLPIERIAAAAGLGPRELQRRFRAKLATTPGHYYAGLRLALGRRMLEHSGKSVSEIAVVCGFASGSAFARAHRARFGVSPTAQRRRA